MKKLRIVLMSLAVVLAFGFTVASSFMPPQLAFYDSNGTASGGGVQAAIDDPEEGGCTTAQTGTICLIGSQWAFNNQTNAEANQGKMIGNPTGVLKRPPSH